MFIYFHKRSFFDGGENRFVIFPGIVSKERAYTVQVFAGFNQAPWLWRTALSHSAAPCPVHQPQLGCSALQAFLHSSRPLCHTLVVVAHQAHACLDFVTLLRTLQSSVVKTWGLACAQVPPGGTSCQEPKRCCKLPVRELLRLFFSQGQDRVAGSALKSEGVLYFFKNRYSILFIY